MANKQPDDHSHFILPDLGEGVAEAELISWKVRPGESVEEMQTLAEMETDKALVEVPSPWAGVIKELPHEPGDIVQVGTILVTFQGETKAKAKTKKTASAASPSRKKAAAGASASEKDAGTVVGSVQTAVSVPPRFARRAETTAPASSAPGKALATPAVRRLAREKGIDIAQVTGTGRGGRVTASDVEALAGASTATPPVPVSADGVAQRIPFRGVRRKIAQALDHSVKTAVHFTVVDEADVTLLDRKRQEYAAVLGRKLGFMPLILTAVSRALRHHPTLNANVDDEREEILIKDVINLGIAVDTDHGLMVPVLHEADRLGFAALEDSVAKLAAACRDRSIAREQLVGGTFTISNVGPFGGIYSTPIINYPEVAILGTGRIRETVLTRDGAFYAGKVLPLSLSCDHRVVDGAEGTRFLGTLIRLLQSPEELIK